MTKQPTKTQKDKSKLTKEEWREYTKTVWQIANTSDPHHPAVFPAEIPKRLIKLFSFCGETVLDPFGGTGTTAVAALELGRHAVCVEQNADYAKIIRRRCHALSNGEDHAQVILGDSRNMELYGIRPVFEECYRVLMPGRKLCVVTANVNQHTEHGLLTFPLAADFICQLRDIGFVLVNEIVWSKDGTGGKWGSHGKQRPIFGSYPYPPNFLFKNVHEYVVIVAKPPGKRANGKTVVSYDYLMGRSEHCKPKGQRKRG